jgi:hypothetical protein
MLRIKQMDKIRNEDAYRRTDEERVLRHTIKKRRTIWICHTLRHNGFARNTMEEKIEGKSQEEGQGINTYMG